MKNHVRCLVCAALSLLFLQACSSALLVPKPKLDSPAHHVETGFKLMELEKYASAKREFKRAIELDPRFISSHVGLAIAFAYEGDYQKGLDSLETAKIQAGKKEDQRIVQVGVMRIFTIGDGSISPDWLNQVESAFQKAKEIDPESPDAYFYMGVAYRRSNRYDDALGQFIRVFEIGKGFVEAADREYTAIQRLKRYSSQ
ncbi:MAG: tetratricopeptide repeat protein [Thermodesulfobacteriota bacterium]